MDIFPSDIQHEYQLVVNGKRYIADLYANLGSDRIPGVVVEAGNVDHEKVRNLREANYLVFTIPYGFQEKLSENLIRSYKETISGTLEYWRAELRDELRLVQKAREEYESFIESLHPKALEKKLLGEFKESIKETLDAIRLLNGITAKINNINRGYLGETIRGLETSAHTLSSARRQLKNAQMALRRWEMLIPAEKEEHYDNGDG